MNVGQIPLEDRFFGEETLTLDIKGRIRIPAEYFRIIKRRSKNDHSLYLEITKKITNIYDFLYMHRNIKDFDCRRLEKLVYDSNARIIVPEKIRRRMSINKRIVLYASKDGEYLCMRKSK